MTRQQALYIATPYEAAAVASSYSTPNQKGPGCDANSQSTKLPPTYDQQILRNILVAHFLVIVFSAFSTTPYSTESLPTLPDVGRLPEIIMAAVKPEVVVSREREEIPTKF